MANVIEPPVWALDSTGTIVAAGTMVRVRGLRWIGATTAGHVCLIREASSSRDVWKSEANGANFRDADAPTWTINGFVLQTLGSGILYVEVV